MVLNDDTITSQTVLTRRLTLRIIGFVTYVIVIRSNVRGIVSGMHVLHLTYLCDWKNYFVVLKYGCVHGL